MTLGATPTLQAVNTELGRASGFAFDMNADTSARQLANVSLTPGVPWSMSSLAGRSCYVQTMVVGKDPSFSIYGFNDPALAGGNAFGSMSTRVVAGAVIYGMTDSAVMTVIIQGVLPQNFWTTIELKDSLNSAAYTRFYSSQAADYAVIGGVYTRWSQFASGTPNFAARNGATVYALFMN